jgi:hypothetical protein
MDGWRGFMDGWPGTYFFLLGRKSILLVTTTVTSFSGLLPLLRRLSLGSPQENTGLIQIIPTSGGKTGARDRRRNCQLLGSDRKGSTGQCVWAQQGCAVWTRWITRLTYLLIPLPCRSEGHASQSGIAIPRGKQLELFDLSMEPFIHIDVASPT